MQIAASKKAEVFEIQVGMSRRFHVCVMKGFFRWDVELFELPSADGNRGAGVAHIEQVWEDEATYEGAAALVALGRHV
jgi:hypothetical protein